MSELFFLSAYAPLTKTFNLDAQGNLDKSPYPMVKNFTSHREEYSSLKDIYAALVKHAKLKHCMIKGKLNFDLVDQPRKGATNSTDATNILLLDADGAPFESHEALMNAIPELKNVSYVVQHSSSYGFSDKLSCHIFVLLDSYINASLLKPWLMKLNLSLSVFRNDISLTKTGAALHWPIDLTTCQNDKLIYIAPPILGKGIKSPVKDEQRIQLVKKKENTVSTHIFNSINGEAYTKEARTLLDDLRKKAGYEKLPRTTKWIGEDRIQTKPGVAQITGIRVGDEFTHLNLNGGDSWGYYYLNNDFDLLRNFKGEDVYYTKELLPDHYRELLSQRDEYNKTPTAEGIIPLVFRDPKVDRYFNGTWDPENYELKLYTASDVQRLRDFMVAHGGRSFGDNVPLWDLHFTPSSNEVYDPDNKRLNTFVPTKYLRTKYKVPSDKPGTKWPVIMKVIKSAICGDDTTLKEEADALLEHFLNWLAVIMQYRCKTGTAWLLTGIEGTGKGTLVNNIIAPLLGRDYVFSKPASSLEDSFTAWIPKALVVFIDEIDIKVSPKRREIVDKLKNLITDHTTDTREMRTDARQVVNFLNFIFSSNRYDPVELNESDRRYNVGIYQTQKIKLTQFEIDELIPAELDHFAQYLMTRKADRAAAGTPVSSSSRTAIIESSRSSADEVGAAVLNGRLGVLADSLMDVDLLSELHGHNPLVTTAKAFEDIMRREVSICLGEAPAKVNVQYNTDGSKVKTCKYTSKLSRDDLFVIFQHCVGNMPTTPNKFTMLLRHRGINMSVIRIGNSTTRGVFITWEISDEALQQLQQRLQPKVANVSSIKKAKVA